MLIHLSEKQQQTTGAATKLMRSQLMSHKGRVVQGKKCKSIDILGIVVYQKETNNVIIKKKTVKKSS